MKQNSVVACCASLAAAVFAAGLFSGTVRNAASYDDFHAVLRNRNVRPATPLASLLRDDFWGTPLNSSASNTQWRPLTTLSYRMDCAIGGCGGGPLRAESGCLRWMRAADVALHAAASAAVAAAASAAAALPPGASLLAGLLFASHPVHVESVATLYGRADVLCCVLQLCALLLCCCAAALPLHSSSNRRWALFALSLLLALCSALAKETGLTTLVVLPLLAWLLMRRKCPWKLFALCGALAAGAVAARRALLPAWTPPTGYQDNPFAFLPQTTAATAMSYGHVHARYLLWLFAPLVHAPNYGFNAIPPVLTLADPRNALAVAAYAAVLAASVVWLCRRDWTRLFLVAWGVAGLAPASNLLFPVGTAFADRLLYIPSAPFCILLASVADGLLRRVLSNSSVAKKRQQTVLVVIGMAVVGVAASVTLSRLPAWRNAGTLWSSTVAQLPNNVVATHNLAVEMHKINHLAEAADCYERVATLLSESPFELARNDPLIASSKETATAVRASLSRQNKLARDPRAAIELASWCGTRIAEAMETANTGIGPGMPIGDVDSGLKDILLSGSLAEAAPAADDSVLRAVSELHLKTGRPRDLWYVLQLVLASRSPESPCAQTARDLLASIEPAVDGMV